MNMINKFVRLIESREALIKVHFGENLRTMLNFPKEREWYMENIKVLDNKIISIAKNILPGEHFEEISDVYGNEYLMNKYSQYKNDKALGR